MVFALGGKLGHISRMKKKKLSTGIQNDTSSFSELNMFFKKNQYLMLVVKGAVRSTHQSSDLLIILGYDLFRPKQLLSETNLYV